MTILDDILEIKKDEIAKLKKKYSLNSFKEMEFFNTSSLSFYKEIKNNKNVSIIAEIKKASPSKGIIKKDFNHVKIAEEYFSSGINAVSILTDERFFQGSISFLRDIAAIKKVTLLIKYFIID
jgi:indole-3-glycerol phosphate synthase